MCPCGSLPARAVNCKPLNTNQQRTQKGLNGMDSRERKGVKDRKNQEIMEKV